MSNKREKEVGKMSRFLRVFAFVVGVFFAGNVLAGGYTCPTYKVYTGCNKGYYLTGSPTSNVHDATQGKVGNACRPCSVMGQYNGIDKYTCAGGTAAPVKKVVTVTYIWNGAKYRPSDQIIPMPTETYDFGIPIDLLDDNENQYYRAGYQFRGWSTSQTATSGTFTMTFDDSTTLYAVWVPCGQGRYKPASATAAASCSSMSSGYYGTGCASDGYTACTGQAQCTGTTYCQDHIKQECPDPNLAKNRRETLPAAYKGAKFASAGVESANGRTEPGQCKALIWYDPDPNATGQRVGLFEYVFLSDATMRYEGDVENWMYDAVGPGYYLTNKSACGAYAYYKQVVACPDGSYCPGKAKVSCNASNQSTVHTTDFGRMSCPGEYTHSDGARSSINDCYLTTAAGKYVATAKSAEETCTAGGYCPGGVKVNWNSTGGRTPASAGYYVGGTGATSQTACPGEYTSSDGARSSVNNCYLMTTAGKYVATAKENQVACNVTDPTDYYYPGGIKVYYGSTGGWAYMDTGYQNAALSGGSCANIEPCPAGTWADVAGLCPPVDAGTYPTECAGKDSDGYDIGCFSMEYCSSLPGSPKTGTFNSPQGAKSNRECTYAPLGKTITGCATVTPITVTYTGQSWPANIGAYAVTPKTGYVAKNNNTATATCVQEIYTIKLNATQNGGTGTLDAIYEKYNTGWYSDSVTNVSISSVPIPTKANSVFNGYYTAATGGTQRITKTGALPATTTFTANTTLYAQFSACAACTKGKGVKSCSASVTDNACEYSATCDSGYKNPTCDSAGKCSCTGNTFYIEYNAGGGSGSAPTAPTSCVVGSGNCYAPENTYTLTGHTFVAWRVGGQQMVRAGTEMSNLFTTMADGGTLTLVAAWVPNSYTIRYIMGDAGESEYREQNVNYNATFTTMSADTFTRSGWTFAGWGGNYPKSDTQYSYTTAGDTILAANWCQNCATVSNGSCTLTVNETTGACTYDTTCNTGYYISSGAGTRAPVCSPSSYAVTYNLNGGSGTAPSAQSCPLGQSCTLNAGTTTAFYRNGYVLAGWSTSQTATSGSFTITITASTTVYAVWTPCAAGTYKPTTANAAATCTTCPAGSYCQAAATTATKCPNWTYAPSSGMASCTACPTLTSGWSKANSTGTGWTSYTSCVQISPTPAGCASGNVKQTAASNGATTWATSVVNTALSADPGYRVNGTSCSICTGATYSAGGTATSCSTCPTIYQSDTTSGKTKDTECKVKTDAGKYIKTAKDSVQTTCPIQTYCPSASVAYGSANSPTACPSAAEHARTTYPADYLNPTLLRITLQDWTTGMKTITDCRANYQLSNEAGNLTVESVLYNATTQKYDVNGSRYYTVLKPGWYFTERYSAVYCDTASHSMLYKNVAQCPENHYCPGYTTMPLCSSGEYTTEKGKFACSSLGTGVYTKSPVKSGADTACYLTTTSAKFVKTAKSAEETCTAGGYCPGGVKVNWGSTGGRNTCPTTYPSSAASSNSELDCYVTTVAGKYVATVGAGQVNCAGTGYYCPGGTNVYSGAYGSRLTTGGRTQCPVGYRDLVATASTTKEAQCAMNVAGGKYVKVAKESAASGTCAAGYAKAAHSVTYGNTSSCAACTGTTYAENTGQASCTACPTQSGVTNISYWISTGTHTDAKGCYGFYNDVALNNGSVARIQCFWDKTKSQYDTSCGAMKDGLKCNAAYYNAALESSPTNNAAYYTDKASVIAEACTSVGKGYWSPADVYTRTQCPAGYRDGAAGVSEAQCAMNVAGGKYVKVAKESAASGTCAAGYAKATHSVTYGNTSSCAACTGATYAASTGQASCTACPTAKTYASAVKSYGYWNNGKDGDHTISDGCYATMTGTLSNGSLTEHGCYLGTDGDYGNAGGKRCYVHQDNLKCNAGYYASTLSNGYVWNDTRAGLLSNTCVGVGAGYYSAANILTRNQCPTGLTTIGYGAGADEAGDCGRVMHMGEDKLYLRSTKKTTPSLNVKVGDTTYYGNMTSGTTKGKLRVKSGTTTYSVHDDSM